MSREDSVAKLEVCLGALIVRGWENKSSITNENSFVYFFSSSILQIRQ